MTGAPPVPRQPLGVRRAGGGPGHDREPVRPHQALLGRAPLGPFPDRRVPRLRRGADHRRSGDGRRPHPLPRAHLPCPCRGRRTGAPGAFGGGASARWRASRDGLDGELVDLAGGRTRPAVEVVDSLLSFLHPDLEDASEWNEVSGIVAETLHRGNGARRQREVFERTGSLVEVVNWGRGISFGALGCRCPSACRHRSASTSSRHVLGEHGG